MKRFHFNIEDGQPYPDDEGALLPDLEAARFEALKILTQILTARPQEFLRTGFFRVTVADEGGLDLFSLTLSKADSAAV
jgi:hypothetical protein